MVDPGMAWNPGDCGPEDERECSESCASWEGGDCDCQESDPGPDSVWEDE